MGTGSFQAQSGQLRVEEWVGQYANDLDTVVLDGRPTSVHAQLDLYRSPACQLNARFSTEEPEDWAIFHSDSCLYYVERGAVTLVLKMRVHYPGGNDLVETAARFEPVDDDWTAVVWVGLGIRLEGELQPRSEQG
jgi:hypothetical protein